jgi:RNA polymerase sigma factor (sigma-70 family)
MDDRDFDNRLSQIATRWSVLLQAHQETDAAAAARQQLLERYCGAVYRYLLAAVRDHHAAEDLTQEFALRFVRGQFRLANPERGRFRDYVKTALFHLVDDYRSRQGRRPSPVPLGGHEPETTPAASEAEQAFTASWREELLARTWRALADEQAAGPPYYAVLRLRVEQPDLSSQQMSERLAGQFGKPVTAAGARQLLHRARERFAELLLEETALSLGPAAAGRLEEELADLNLLRYCRPVLDRRARGGE